MKSILFRSKRDSFNHQASLVAIDGFINYMAAQTAGIIFPNREDITIVETLFDRPLFNPSLIASKADPGSIQMIARSSDVLHYRRWNLERKWTAPNIRNAWMTLDRNLNVIQAREVDDSLLRESCPDAGLGIEDIRLFYVGDVVYGLGTGMSLRRGLERTRCVPVMVQFDGHKIVDFSSFGSPAADQEDSYIKEKNWIPVVLDGELHIIYSFNPTVVLKFSDRSIHRFIGAPSRKIAHFIRGGTGFADYGRNHLLTMVHFEPATHPKMKDGKKFYTHALVVMDKNFNVVEMSDIFVLHKRGIEFAVGLINDGCDYLVSYGIDDRCAAVSRLSEKIVGSLLTTRRE